MKRELNPADILVKVQSVLTSDSAIYDGVAAGKMEQLVRLYDELCKAQKKLVDNIGKKLPQMLFAKAVERFDTYAYEVDAYLVEHCPYYK